MRKLRKRILNIWREVGLFEVSDQQLAAQARWIKNSGWLSEVGIEEVKRKINERDNENEENSQGLDEVFETKFEVDVDVGLYRDYKAFVH